jgi:hypothetical protein
MNFNITYVLPAYLRYTTCSKEILDCTPEKVYTPTFEMIAMNHSKEMQLFGSRILCINLFKLAFSNENEPEISVMLNAYSVKSLTRFKTIFKLHNSYEFGITLAKQPYIRRGK